MAPSGMTTRRMATVRPDTGMAHARVAPRLVLALAGAHIRHLRRDDARAMIGGIGIDRRRRGQEGRCPERRYERQESNVTQNFQMHSIFPD
jgi:hypothetical protein